MSLVYIAKAAKIWNGHAQCATGLQNAQPFVKNPLYIPSFEMLQDVAVVDQVHSVVLDK